jgi:hypothetical protein
VDRLNDAKWLDEVKECLNARRLVAQLQNDTVLAHVNDPSAELVREDVQRL